MQAGTGKGSSGADISGAREAGEHGSVRIKVTITRVTVRGRVRARVRLKIDSITLFPLSQGGKAICVVFIPETSALVDT